MRPLDSLRTAICTALLAGSVWAVAAATPPPGDVTKSLETIKSQADAVASGRDKAQEQLRDAARTIGVEWQKVEPPLARDFLVETRFANDSIAAFEKDWRNQGKARSDAMDVSAKVAALLSVQQQNATPAPSASPSSSPSP